MSTAPPSSAPASYADVKRMALELSDEERDRLAGELSLSVTPEPDATRGDEHPHADEWRGAVNRRIEEIRSGKVELLDGPAMHEQLRRDMEAGRFV